MHLYYFLVNRLVVKCISWFKESKHTNRSSFADITNVVPSLQRISWFKESKHTHRSSLANITNVVPSLLVWTHRITLTTTSVFGLKWICLCYWEENDNIQQFFIYLPDTDYLPERETGSCFPATSAFKNKFYKEKTYKICQMTKKYNEWMTNKLYIYIWDNSIKKNHTNTKT